MKIGLYVHIPFCRCKCLYCDFPSYAGCEAVYEPYTAALCREIAGKGGLFSHGTDTVYVDTIYIGGGTPTLLSGHCLEAIFETLCAHWRIERHAEISIEANPGTVDFNKLKMLRSLGVNRISFGIQSFDDRLLRVLGRLHSASEALQAVKMAKDAGFDNLNIDLMYGLPEQTVGDWRQTLAIAIDLDVPHISAYGLKIEEGTPFFTRQKRGEISLPPEEEDEAMYDWVTEYLPAQGLVRYEISNYAKPGFECRHNLKYWRYRPYLGLGAAAHSFWNGRRAANISSIREYIGKVQSGEGPEAGWENPEKDEAMAEFIFLALRTAAGLKHEEFKRYFGVDFGQRFAAEIIQLETKGLLTKNGQSVKLTPLGMKLGNMAFAAFIPDKP
ncbi:MAG: radical SAM family heme chaperone HemW [Negativicutes bacterium]|nr:radical SAM family heme chaperone HemW [Negativicutes bacterium]